MLQQFLDLAGRLGKLGVVAVLSTILVFTLPTQTQAEILPPCPAPLSITEYFGDPVPNLVLVDGGGSAFYRTVIKGLGRTPACANMSYIRRFAFGQPVPTTSERAITSSVSPSTIQRTDSFTDVTFNVVGAGVPAPFTVSFPPCFPFSTTGTCSGTPFSPTVAIREANSNGEFVGPWSVLHQWRDSPVQFDRLGDCISTAPVGAGRDPSNGPPCTYRVTFLRNPNAANDFILQRPTQVIIHATWSGGITLSGDGTGTDYVGGDYTIFSLLLSPDAPTPAVQSINPEILALISTLETLANSLKRTFPKSQRTEQRFFASELRTKGSTLVDLIEDNPGRIQTSGANVNMTLLGRAARSSLLNLAKRRQLSFSADKRKAKKALGAIRRGLAIS